MVCPLDEVANVCRWRELPDLYSHYGSRGIILMSFLQSWSQGVDVWGEQGMRKLWGAANIRLYGGGSNEQGFLHDISSVCGEMDTRQLTTSYNGGRGGRSRSYATRRGTDLRRGDLGRAATGPGGAHGFGHRPGGDPHPKCARRPPRRGGPGLLGQGLDDRCPLGPARPVR